MIKGKQRAYLRKLANNLDAIIQIGKGDITDNVIRQFDEALEAREMIKATVLKNCEIDVRTVCEEIAEQTNSEIVQVIGAKFVLYRESEDNKKIIIPK